MAGAGALLDELRGHLDSISQDPSEPLDESMIQRFQLQLTAADISNLLPRILPPLLAFLPSLRPQDAPPIRRLISRLIDSLSFTECLGYVTAQSLAQALESPLPSINHLALDVLRKAGQQPSDAALVAGMREVVLALVRQWLMTPEVEVAQESSKILVAMLQVDTPLSPTARTGIPSSASAESETTGPSPRIGGGGGGGANEVVTGALRGQGLMWRRIFEDRGVYAMLFDLTSAGDIGSAHGQESMRQTSLAQSRLLYLVATLVPIDFGAVARSHWRSVEQAHHVSAHQGLLEYALAKMVDATDVLMRISLIETLVAVLRAPWSPSWWVLGADPRTTTLAYLEARGLHAGVLDLYLPSESSMLPVVRMLDGAVAQYVASYAIFYPEHLMAAKHHGSLLINAILARLVQGNSFTMNASDSFHPLSTDPMTADEKQVLVSLPRTALLLNGFKGSGSEAYHSWSSSSLSRLSLGKPDPNALRTLASLFRGPIGPSNFPRSGTAWDGVMPTPLHHDRAASRALYFCWLNRTPGFWPDVVRHAETMVLPEMALAALEFMAAIIDASWALLPDAPPGDDPETDVRHPTEVELRLLFGATSPLGLPTTGLEAILSPPVADVVLPYLCSPPKTFTSLLHGLTDGANATNQIARSKYAVVTLLHRQMRRAAKSGYTMELVAAAVSRGPWASRSAGGGQVATMES
ncbi:MAG: hypothetical protein M1838_004287 [Thelocarpon superellum]|nr:MAG: hypothetical protein M1838_004287 [Thelocarpon superellum]